jgi:serine/threonine-protein kinase
MTAADTIREVAVKVSECPECGARYGIEAAFCPFDGTALSTSTWDRARDPRAHLVVDNRYELLEPLGVGGMGTVYKVRHTTIERFFAMKILREELARDSELAARFVREARATAAIKHPAIVAITDFGALPDDIPYFVMELIKGETLAAHLRREGPFLPSRATRIAKQIAEALQASHDANVIHRDLKPENVFLVDVGAGGRTNETEVIRIVDFGAAKIIGASQLTRPGIVFGTPYYMSPEQGSGAANADARADIYSLGVLLYELVTGRVPFEADTYMGVLTKHMFQAPTPPVAPLGRTLGGLEAVILKTLAKQPEDRYASMAELARALDAVARGEAPPEGESDLRAARSRTRSPMLTTAERIDRVVEDRISANTRRMWILLGSILLAFFGAMATIAGILVSRSTPPASAPALSASATPASSPSAEGAPAAAAVSAPAPEGSLASPAESASRLTPSPGNRLPVVGAPHRPVPASPKARAPSGAVTLPVSASAPGSNGANGSRSGSAEDFRDPWAR